MFSYQNKQVTTKFLSTHLEARSQPNKSTKMKPTAIATIAKVGEASKKLATAADAASSLYELKTKSVEGDSTKLAKPQLETQPRKLASKSDKSISSAGSRKIKINYPDNISSRMRIVAATLPRTSPPLAKRIYRPSPSRVFDYDLSKEEAHFFGQSRKAMKSVPADELLLLKTGSRSTYLETRYAHTPDAKYNYPEATSWRYGWFHRFDAAK